VTIDNTTRMAKGLRVLLCGILAASLYAPLVAREASGERPSPIQIQALASPAATLHSNRSETRFDQAKHRTAPDFAFLLVQVKRPGTDRERLLHAVEPWRTESSYASKRQSARPPPSAI